VWPSPPPYNLHAQSPCVNQFKDGCDHHSFYPLDVCSYCQSFNHDVNSCPYYDISDEPYATLYAMIETMNERHEHFVSEMRKFGLLYETALVYLSLGLSLVSMTIISLPFPQSVTSLMMHL